MSVPEYYIPRQQDESEFQQLRSAMIEHVQSLSGHVWTDFNLHDPGVTIIEQLCYALTDINDRSDSSVDDLLCDKNGVIDLHKQGLFTPEEAFPCRPVTLSDYQKYFQDQLDGLQYLLITLADIPGHYNLHIKPEYQEDYRTSAEHQEEIKQKAVQLFNQVRNLGEDIYQINFIPEQDGVLSGVLEISDERIAEETLAAVYLRIHDQLSGQWCPEMDEQSGLSSFLSQALTGPLLKKNARCEEHAANTCQEIPLSSLISSVRSLNGINSIQSLAIAVGGVSARQDYLPSLQQCSIKLVIPRNQDDLQVQLFCQGCPVKVNMQVFHEAYQRLKHHQRTARRTAQHRTAIQTVSGNNKELSIYTSIQTQFPETYGVNLNGVPAGCSTERKAQALQLKGYLMHFDQILSDHCAMIDQIKQIFSTSIETSSSYPSNALTSESVESLDKLYIEKPESDFLASTLYYENIPERKEKVLDYLLALNGRDKQVYGFEYLNPYFENEEARQITLRSKQLNLIHIHELSANRAAAFDYTAQTWGQYNLSAMEKYLANIIGVDARCRSFVMPLKELDLRLDTNEGRLYFGKTTPEWETLSEDIGFFYHGAPLVEPQAIASLRRIPGIAFQQASQSDFLRQFSRHLRRFKADVVAAVMKAGIRIENYRMLESSHADRFELFISIDSESGQQQWQYLSSFPDSQQVIKAANQFRQGLIQLNLDMEGLHLIEHNLLMPVSDGGHKQGEGESNSFYFHQISVVLPGWTVRFADAGFRLYMESLIRAECPAHIHANIYWLDYSQMEKFEILYKSWLFKKSRHNSPEQINPLSERLVHILQSFE